MTTVRLDQAVAAFLTHAGEGRPPLDDRVRRMVDALNKLPRAVLTDHASRHAAYMRADVPAEYFMVPGLDDAAAEVAAVERQLYPLDMRNLA